MTDKTKGIFLTILLASIIVLVFFGEILKEPNNYYFSAGGDGFKAYYGAIYHLEYDTSAMRMNGMNYPYGEMIFFTGSQPLVVNTVKFISKYIFDINDHIVGIINVLMILSVVVAALFLFLIFYELKINWLFASFAAIGICMLSPQIERFGGHFSLSWLFWIPAMVYLVMRFDKKPSFFIAIIMGMVTLLAGAMHMYFFGFYLFIIGLYFISELFDKERQYSISKGFLFFVIQFLLPVIILQIIISAYDPVPERTTNPYGLLEYRAHPVGIFFPGGKPYAFVPQFLTVFKHISWESLAFIGVTALAGFLFGTIVFFKKVISKKNPFNVTDNHLLNILFWSSFAALLFSFGIPFVFGLEGLAAKLGPLKQLRALARFSWFFFYMLNIVVFYSVYKKTRLFKLKWKIVAAMAFAFLFFDGYWNINLKSRRIHNQIPVLEDKQNTYPENDWISHVNPDDYQAILPIPYFHVGSENIWIGSKNGTQELTMIASLKTGLPTLGVLLSRTSIDQTFTNYALVTEPTEPFSLLNILPDKRPFLLLFNKQSTPNANEKRLIRLSTAVYQNNRFELRRLEIDSLKSLPGSYNQEILNGYRNSRLFNKNEFQVTDSISYFYVNGFNENQAGIAFEGDGAFKFRTGEWNKVVTEKLMNVKAGTRFAIGFWIYDYKKDGNLRSVLKVVQKDTSNSQVTNSFKEDFHRHIKAFIGKWALIELTFVTKSNNEQIELFMKNSILKKSEIIVDGLVIRQEGVDLFFSEDQKFYRNGRKISVHSDF